MNVPSTKNKLSILLPTFNNVCIKLVECLRKQCEKMGEEIEGGLWFEIIVADDGSTDSNAVQANRHINGMRHCRFVERTTNAGRSKIRNYLAREAKGEWLLFLDSDVAIDDDMFIDKYLKSEGETVIYGGVLIMDIDGTLSQNLRYRYEKAEEHKHIAEERSKAQHKSFRTTNFMARKDIMLATPFDESITAYGYEDVLFGKRLCEKGITVAHIDNPVTLMDYEDNERFVAKTEESLRTLFQLRRKISDYSNLLVFIGKTSRIGLPSLLFAWHKMANKLERRNLTGRHPCLLAFKLYKIGYYISLK